MSFSWFMRKPNYDLRPIIFLAYPNYGATEPILYFGGVKIVENDIGVTSKSSLKDILNHSRVTHEDLKTDHEFPHQFDQLHDLNLLGCPENLNYSHQQSATFLNYSW